MLLPAENNILCILYIRNLHYSYSTTKSVKYPRSEFPDELEEFRKSLAKSRLDISYKNGRRLAQDFITCLVEIRGPFHHLRRRLHSITVYKIMPRFPTRFITSHNYLIESCTQQAKFL